MWQIFFAKAQSNLQAAERDRSHSAFDPCVSRAYFAAFQAAIAALLALTDYRRRGQYWDHGEIAAEFARRLIRQRKIFGGEMASILDDLKTRRHQADYSTFSMSEKIAQRALDKSRKLVELIEAALESTGGG
ncbi:MAG: HEPN domain-containing protein [candidate division NC10 bacterium]|nr:HEPN domain-containing protein [candidate division NC10 bacterium]